jgi:hypothetical protein
MKLRGKVSLCRTCGEVFTTTSTFDRHRVGKHDIAAPHYGRRCLTPTEMLAGGFAQNDRGRWYRANTGPVRAYAIQGEAISDDPPPPCVTASTSGGAS